MENITTAELREYAAKKHNWATEFMAAIDAKDGDIERVTAQIESAKAAGRSVPLDDSAIAQILGVHDAVIAHIQSKEPELNSVIEAVRNFDAEMKAKAAEAETK